MFTGMINWTAKSQRSFEESGVTIFRVKTTDYKSFLRACHAFAARGYRPTHKLERPAQLYRFFAFFMALPHQERPFDLDWQETEAVNRICNLDFDTTLGEFGQVKPEDFTKPVRVPSWPSAWPVKMVHPALHTVLPLIKPLSPSDLFQANPQEKLVHRGIGI